MFFIVSSALISVSARGLAGDRDPAAAHSDCINPQIHFHLCWYCTAAMTNNKPSLIAVVALSSLFVLVSLWQRWLGWSRNRGAALAGTSTASAKQNKPLVKIVNALLLITMISLGAYSVLSMRTTNDSALFINVCSSRSPRFINLLRAILNDTAIVFLAIRTRHDTQAEYYLVASLLLTTALSSSVCSFLAVEYYVFLSFSENSALRLERPSDQVRWVHLCFAVGTFVLGYATAIESYFERGTTIRGIFYLYTAGVLLFLLVLIWYYSIRIGRRVAEASQLVQSAAIAVLFRNEDEAAKLQLSRESSVDFAEGGVARTASMQEPFIPQIESVAVVPDPTAPAAVAACLCFSARGSIAGRDPMAAFKFNLLILTLVMPAAIIAEAYDGFRFLTTTVSSFLLARDLLDPVILSIFFVATQSLWHSWIPSSVISIPERSREDKLCVSVRLRGASASRARSSSVKEMHAARVHDSPLKGHDSRAAALAEEPEVDEEPASVPSNGDEIVDEYYRKASSLDLFADFVFDLQRQESDQILARLVDQTPDLCDAAASDAGVV